MGCVLADLPVGQACHWDETYGSKRLKLLSCSAMGCLKWMDKSGSTKTEHGGSLALCPAYHPSLAPLGK